MHVHTLSEEDRAFRAAFEACVVAPAAFTHEAHLRLAYAYLVEHGPSEARQRMRASLFGFLGHYRIPLAKYHETLTSAWVLAVNHFMNRCASSCFSEFASLSKPLLDSRVMLTHYTAELLFSLGTRASFVEPDLEAIPS